MTIARTSSVQTKFTMLSGNFRLFLVILKLSTIGHLGIYWDATKNKVKVIRKIGRFYKLCLQWVFTGAIVLQAFLGINETTNIITKVLAQVTIVVFLLSNFTLKICNDNVDDLAVCINGFIHFSKLHPSGKPKSIRMKKYI